jgi:hypothetical protein
MKEGEEEWHSRKRAKEAEGELDGDSKREKCRKRVGIDCQGFIDERTNKRLAERNANPG